MRTGWSSAFFGSSSFFYSGFHGLFFFFEVVVESGELVYFPFLNGDVPL